MELGQRRRLVGNNLSTVRDLKERTIRGGSARIVAQAANFAMRVASVMILSRLLDPKDFGLLGMVTAVTGVLSLFRDFGLSVASVQLSSVTQEQASTLFWINVLFGAALTAIALCSAPVISAFYHEPRLFGLTSVVAMGFLINGAGVQHSALLQRQMRFTELALIDIISLTLSTAVAVGGAKAGYGYWALAAMTVSQPLAGTVGLWLVGTWVPGAPHRGIGIRSMMRFGGTVTLNGLVVYVSSNLDKILLGRFWGAEVLGIYGRAYQLIRIPTENLNSAVGDVAFSALSRVQDEPDRLRRYFLKGYSVVLAFTLPITIACALFADDLILVLLGPKWKGAAPIFRLLAPTILVFAIVNPFAWLLTAIGMVGRGLRLSLVVAPLIIASYVIGLRHGPLGVAFAYSTVMILCVAPLIAWIRRGTVISFYDTLLAVSRPMISGVVAAACAFVLQFLYGPFLSPIPRLILGVSLLLAVYIVMLLFVMRQGGFYLDLLRALRRRS